MAVRRMRAGFRRAADLAPRDLGLPGARARELILARAWAEIAGAALARRAPALGVRRGVLEIRCPDGPWGVTLPALAPDLAARLAAGHPELGVMRYRLVPEGDRAPGPLQALADRPDPRRAERVGCREIAAADSPAPAEPPSVERRLESAMDAYLARRRADPTQSA